MIRGNFCFKMETLYFFIDCFYKLYKCLHAKILNDAYQSGHFACIQTQTQTKAVHEVWNLCASVHEFHDNCMY